MGIPVIELGDKQLNTSSEKAKAFTEFFQNHQTLNIPAGHSPPPHQPLTNQRLEQISTTPGEVEKILDSLELGKAHGVDGISARLLKETSSSISGPLCSLINASFDCGKVPITWKQANVSPIHKKDSRSSLGNYRPISLLPIPAKVQERVAFRRIYRYLSDNGLLTPKNSGFKERDSAICQLISIVDNIYKALEAGNDINMVFLDVSKAFDRVWHEGLLHKIRANGIVGNLYLWLEDYLLDRQIRVVINGQEAPWAKINAGVPQGSILGPLLFLIFINDIVTDIESDINLFADDTSLLNIIDQLQTTYDTLNRDLDTLANWADRWLVTFNASKTVSLHITKKREALALPDLNLNGSNIKQVESHCHLGVDLESDFSWLTHIQRISGKASKCVGLMRRTCRELPRECMENLYTTMVRPIMEYGGVLFDGCPKNQSTLLDKVQREAALVCTGAYKHTKNTNLMHEVGWTSLGTRRSMQKACVMYKIQNNLAPAYLIDKCPQLVSETSNYNLRNAENVSLPLGKKTCYFNSFYPSAIRIWNDLDRGIRNSPSLDSFKYNLKKAKCLKKNKLFQKFNGVRAVNHTRMRLGLSGLKSQRQDYNHVPLSTCDFCGARKEDALHFFLKCRVFAPMRTVLLGNITRLYQTKNILRDLSRTIVQKELVTCLLCGDPRLSDLENIEMFKMVQVYIAESKRF